MVLQRCVLKLIGIISIGISVFLNTTSHANFSKENQVLLNNPGNSSDYTLSYNNFKDQSLPIYASLFPKGESNLKPETPELRSEASTESTFLKSVKEVVGINYFTFLYGPGILPDSFRINPNQLGNPENDGISAQNQVSVRYKFSSNLALDFQSRFRVFFNNGVNNDKFQYVRWETPRIGISGRLISGNDWSLIGAINTDFPYYFPSPLSGYQARQRTVFFNPGMFASLKWEPRKSRWSFFSVVSPRYFFYSDRNAAEPQFYKAGFVAENKPELIIALQPTVSYQLTENSKFTFGTSIDYRKQVISSWNFTNASLLSNGPSQAWRIYAIPLSLGMSYTFSPAITVFPFINAYPIAIQRVDAITGKQATFLESASLGMWINGTIF